jgi:hypothetical protein
LRDWKSVETAIKARSAVSAVVSRQHREVAQYRIFTLTFRRLWSTLSNNPNNLTAAMGVLSMMRSRQMGHLGEKLGRRRGFCRGHFTTFPAVECAAKTVRNGTAKGRRVRIAGRPDFSDSRRFPMTRQRIAGFLFIVFVLALSSLAIAQSKKQIDINSASEEEMVAIGIEKAAAKKIIEARPYRSKAELVSKQLLSRTQYDKLKDLIVAKQAAAIKEVPSKPAGK